MMRAINTNANLVRINNNRPITTTTTMNPNASSDITIGDVKKQDQQQKKQQGLPLSADEQEYTKTTTTRSTSSTWLANTTSLVDKIENSNKFQLNFRMNDWLQNNITESKRSWHLETLFGLLINCEDELVASGERGVVVPAFLDSSVSRTADTDTSINNLLVPDHTDQTRSFKSSQSTRQRFNKGTSVKLKGRPTIYYSKEHEEERQLSSELLILPTILKSFDVNMNISTDASKYPSKYKRIDYAARDIQQTEKYVLNKFQDWYATTKMNEENSSVPALSKMPALAPQKFKVCTLLYNQCSINALATWAARAPRKEQVLGRDNVSQHFSTRTTNAKAQESQEQSSFKSKLFYCPVPSTSTFRRCSICHLFGHLEVECREVPHESISQRSCQLEIASHLRIQATLQDFATAAENEENFITNEQLLSSSTAGRKSIPKESKSNAYSADHDKFSSSPWTMIKTNRREDVVGEEAKKPSDLTNDDVIIIQEQGTNNRQEPDDVRDGSNFNHDDDVFVPNCTTCKICHSGFRYEDILLCDGCNMLFHRQCLNPPLESIPDGEWFCEECDPYDSDVSSYIDIEGLDGFVIEQRKRSTAESENCDIDVPMRVGFDSNDWNVVMCVATTNKNKILSTQNHKYDFTSNDYDNTIDLSTRFDGNHESTHMFVEGEICWIKHSVYGEFWPAVVVEVLNPHVKVASEILYTVKLIRDFGENVVNGKSLIPFMTNSLLEMYKQKRYYRTLTPQKALSWYEALDNAVEEVLHELGCCTIDIALKNSRDSTKISESSKNSLTKKIPMETVKKKRNLEKKKQKKGHQQNQNQQPKQLRPAEWNNAEMSVEDGFVIFARSLKDEIRNKKEKLAGFSNLEQEPSNSSACNGDDEINVIQRSRNLPVENLLGSIVAYPINLQNDKISNVESMYETKWNFGAVYDISKARDGKILIRHLPELHDTISTSKKKSILESTGNSLNDNFTNEIEIHCCSIGSSLWIPIDKVVLIKEGRQTLRSRRFFSTAIKNELLNEMNRTKRKLNDEAINREENMVEIVSLNSDASMKENTSQDVVDNTSDFKSTLHLPSQHDDVTETHETPHFTTISSHYSKARSISNVDDKISNNLPSQKTSKFIEKTRESSSPSLQRQIHEDLDRTQNISESLNKNNEEDIDSPLILPDDSALESNDKDTIIIEKERIPHTLPTSNLQAEQEKKRNAIKKSAITTEKSSSSPPPSTLSSSSKQIREIETRRKTSSSHSTGRPKRMRSPSPRQRSAVQTSTPLVKSENKERVSGTRTKTSKKKRKSSASYSVDDVSSPGSVLKKLDEKQTLDDGEELFFAEEILDERTRQPGNVKEYFIRWKDYPLEACTWEPEKSFLHSNFLRTYHAQKKLIELRATKEATDERTPTARMIRILEYGLEKMAAHPEDEASSSKRKRKICPFCLNSSDSHSSYGGHMRQHINDANYKMIKSVHDFIVDTWYEQERALNGKKKR